MRWVAIFEPMPQIQAIREQFEPAHLAYLRANQKEILLAGGLRENESAPFGGGLWVLAEMSKARAVELVERDPYFIHSKRGYKLLQWGKALQEISVTL